MTYLWELGGGGGLAPGPLITSTTVCFCGVGCTLFSVFHSLDFSVYFLSFGQELKYRLYSDDDDDDDDDEMTTTRMMMKKQKL